MFFDLMAHIVPWTRRGVLTPSALRFSPLWLLVVLDCLIAAIDMAGGTPDQDQLAWVLLADFGRCLSSGGCDCLQ